MAAIAFILFAISAGDVPPDFTALAQFESKQACSAAATQISDALAKSDQPKMMLCVSVDSLKDLAQQNGMTGAGN